MKQDKILRVEQVLNASDELMRIFKEILCGYEYIDARMIEQTYKEAKKALDETKDLVSEEAYKGMDEFLLETKVQCEDWMMLEGIQGIVVC